MTEGIVIGALVGLSVYAIAYCYIVLRDRRAGSGKMFGDLLTPQFRSYAEGFEAARLLLEAQNADDQYLNPGKKHGR